MNLQTNYLLLCAAVFAVSYLTVIIYTSIFYHRAFTHNALTLKGWFRRFIVITGPLVTGMDIKAWACMHRLHHRYSDTKRDPHSPVFAGIPGVLIAQLLGYGRVIKGLNAGRRPYVSIISDLDVPVNWYQRKRLWWLPYALQISIAVSIGVFFNAWLVGIAFLAGIMSHPVQGWIINSFGHAVGYRNFNSTDNSRNNMPAALLVLGEGFQNNHHSHPASAKFSYKAWEFDGGYLVCRILDMLGLAKINRPGFIPAVAGTPALKPSPRPMP